MSAFPVASTSSLSPPGPLTFDDLEEEEAGVYISGAPLTRMIDWECLSISSMENEEDCCWDNPFHENINAVDDGFSLSDYLLNGGESDEEDGYSHIPIPQHHLQQAIEDIPHHADDINSPRVSISLCKLQNVSVLTGPKNKWLLQSTVSTSLSRKILIRHLPSVSRSSRELSIWRFLNQPHMRRDPWNPVPPALSIVEREVGLSASARFARLVEFGPEEDHRKEFEAFIAVERLYPLHDNPLETRIDWIDFIRQMLQVNFFFWLPFSPYLLTITTFFFLLPKESCLPSRAQCRTSQIYLNQ